MSRRAEARKQRDIAIARAYCKSSEEFRSGAERAVRKLATDGKNFITDHIYDLMSSVELDESDKRAIGGLIQRLGRSGVIKQTGGWQRSWRRHMSRQIEWTAGPNLQVA